MYIRTLPSVIKGTGIVGVMANRLVKALECFFRVSLFHVYVGHLNKTLRKSGTMAMDSTRSTLAPSKEPGDVMRKIRLVDQRDIIWLHT